MPRDTDPRAAAADHRLIGAMPPAERLAQAARLSLGVRALAQAGLRRRHRKAGEEELRWRFAALCYGRELAERAFGPLSRSVRLSTPDLLAVAAAVGRAFEHAGIKYFLGGSLASSYQGEPRATNGSCATDAERAGRRR